MTRRHLLALLPALSVSAAPHDGVVKRARDFLAGLFDAELSLLPEFRGSQTYWLFHDNWLAARVLKASHPELAGKIEAALKANGHTESGKIEIVTGESKQPLPFRAYELIEVRRVGAKTIKTEVVRPRVFDDWQPYADLLLLASMAESDEAKARAHFDAARKMWDGTGFADRVVAKANQYATFKLAMALIAAKRRGFEFPEKADVTRELLARQHDDGGFITDYRRDGKNVGFANVETTSLAVLALT